MALGPLFTNTDVNFNPCMDKLSYIYYKVWNEITYPFPNFNGAILHFINMAIHVNKMMGWVRWGWLWEHLSQFWKYLGETTYQYDGVTPSTVCLTRWGQVTHICVSDLTSIGSDNGLSPGRRQAIIRTKAGILLIRPLGTNFSEFLVEILMFSFKKMRLTV